MKRNVPIASGGGPVSVAIRIIDHVGVTALDLWDDEDANGRPDRFLRRMKDPNQHENAFVEIGMPVDLVGKVLQWIWMPSQPPSSTDDWQIELHVTQGGASVGTFPLKLSGKYPSGKKYGLFETWIRFTESQP